MNALIITTENRRSKTTSLGKWVESNFGKRAFVSSFDSVEGSFIGSILIGDENGNTPVERIYSVCDADSGHKLSIEEVQEIIWDFECFK